MHVSPPETHASSCSVALSNCNVACVVIDVAERGWPVCVSVAHCCSMEVSFCMVAFQARTSQHSNSYAKDAQLLQSFSNSACAGSFCLTENSHNISVYMFLIFFFFLSVSNIGYHCPLYLPITLKKGKADPATVRPQHVLRIEGFSDIKQGIQKLFSLYELLCWAH